MTHWYAGECGLPERDGKVEGRGEKEGRKRKTKGKKKERLQLLAFANFCGVNNPSVISMTSLHMELAEV